AARRRRARHSAARGGGRARLRLGGLAVGGGAGGDAAGRGGQAQRRDQRGGGRARREEAAHRPAVHSDRQGHAGGARGVRRVGDRALGEGAAAGGGGRDGVTKASWYSLKVRTRHALGLLPLPEGEGWGEGVTDLRRVVTPSPQPSPLAGRGGSTERALPVP